MINKVSEEWDGVEETAGRAGPNLDPREAARLLDAIRTVREALRAMCQVHVTRTTLKAAVKEALQSILREEPRAVLSEVFSEITSLRGRLDALASSGAPAPKGAGGLAREAPPAGREDLVPPAIMASRLDSLQENYQRIFDLERELRASLTSQGGRFSGLEGEVQRVDGRVDKVQARVESLDSKLGGLDGSLAQARQGLLDLSKSGEERGQEIRSELASLEAKLAEARDRFSGLLGKLEASVPERIAARTGELEDKLRREIDQMLNEVAGRLSELRAILLRVEEMVPRREAVDGVSDRLDRAEQRVQKVSAHVESIDSLTPDLRALDEKLRGLKGQLESLFTEVGASGRELGDLRGSLGQGLSEVKSLVDSGIQRWEAEQSQVLERVSAMRDTLRDQLRAAGEQVKGGEGTLWRKITGKQGGLKLNREEWDSFSAKVESIISGLESILAKKRGG